MQLVVSCAGDNELAKKLHSYLTSKFSSAPYDLISLREDEVTIQNMELGIKNAAVRKFLDEFVGSNPDLAGYSITEFGDIFTIGVAQSLDKVVLTCEMCGYLARHEDELNIHKRTHGLLFMP
jgi:hypothetical protein